MVFKAPLKQKPKRYIWLSILAGIVLVGILLLTVGHYIDVVKQALSIRGTTFYVAPNGDNTQTGHNKAKPLASVQLALDRAEPGDTVQLADGDYYQSIHSARSGRKRAPITITGTKDAILFGSESRIIEIRHSYLVLDGFQVNGQWSAGDAQEHFRDKLIYVIGNQSRKGVEGLKLKNLLLQNAGGECVRLRYFARYNEISDSVIRNCGIYDFRFSAGGKNGEGIYIGTAPEQLKDGKNPTADPDESAYNYVHHNTIETYGNECVDIKEASFKNLVEHNTCRQQKDPKSGGFDARGSRNTFRNNTVEDTVGAAVRLGGDTKTDGIDNNVYDNVFKRNTGGPLNIQRLPQATICGNSVGYKYSTDPDVDIDPAAVCD